MKNPPLLQLATPPHPHTPKLEEHAAFLLPFRYHLEGVQAAVAPVAVPAAERDEGAVIAVVPGAIFVHVPQTVLVPTDCKTDAIQKVRQHDTSGKRSKEESRKTQRRFFLCQFTVVLCLCFMTHFPSLLLVHSAFRKNKYFYINFTCTDSLHLSNSKPNTTIMYYSTVPYCIG